MTDLLDFTSKDPRSPNLVKDPFWYNDWKILFQSNRLIEFLPTPDMTFNEKLNALMRLSIYFAVVMIIIKKSYVSLYVPIFVGLVTYVIYQKNESQEHMNHMQNENMIGCGDRVESYQRQVMNEPITCTPPTKDNPFMNFNQITDDRTRAPACPSYDDPFIKKDVESKFNEDLYRDVSDIWSKRNSQREFYTVPSTQAMGDQGAFARWLYGTDATCKENTIKCAPYDNLGQSYKEFLI